MHLREFSNGPFLETEEGIGVGPTPGGSHCTHESDLTPLFHPLSALSLKETNLLGYMVSENVRKTFKLCPCAWYPARKKKPERVTQMTWLKSKCKTTLFSRTIDFDQPLPRFWPKEKCPKSLLVLLGRNAKTIIFDTKCCLFLDHFHSASFWHTRKRPCSIYLPISGPPRSSWDIMVAQAVFCRSLIKVKFFIDQVRPALGSVGWLSPCSKKPQNCPISDFFNLTPKYFLPYCLILTWNHLLLTQ